MHISDSRAIFLGILRKLSWHGLHSHKLPLMACSVEYASSQRSTQLVWNQPLHKSQHMALDVEKKVLSQTLHGASSELGTGDAVYPLLKLDRVRKQL